MCKKINHISHEFKVVDVADELLEISKHAMFSTVDAIPVPSEGLVHQLMTETCYDSGERMKIVHRVGFLYDEFSREDNII